MQAAKVHTIAMDVERDHREEVLKNPDKWHEWFTKGAEGEPFTYDDFLVFALILEHSVQSTFDLEMTGTFITAVEQHINDDNYHGNDSGGDINGNSVN
jgi:hypothetical protein